MIELITGKPGSGKTYLAVMRMTALPAGKYVVFHNIAGLKPECFPEPAMMKEIPAGSLENWVTRASQEQFAEAVKEKYGRPMLVVIDEAQMLFGERNEQRKSWLSWHRHLGQDVWLIAQHYRMIHSDYYNLCEYEIRALKSLLVNMLIYQYRTGGEAFKTMRKRKDPKVYAAYRSFDASEAQKPAFHLVYWIVGLMVVAIGLS